MQVIAICTAACASQAESGQLPAGWLFHHRWAKQTSGSIDSPLGRIHFDTASPCFPSYPPRRIHFDTAGGPTTAFLTLILTLP